MDQINLLITGTSGFLGKEIVSYFSQFNNYKIFEIKGRKDFFQLEEILKKHKIDCLIHSGFAVEFTTFIKENIESSLNIINTKLTWSLGHKYKIDHYIFLSAAGIFGVSRDAKELNENELGKVIWPFQKYLTTKYIQEKIYADKNILNSSSLILTKLYLTTVYGPNMPKKTLDSIINGPKIGPCMLVPPGGTSFLSMNDFLINLKKIIDNKIPGNFILSSGNTSYKNLFKISQKILGKNKKIIITVPKFFVYLLVLIAPIVKIFKMNLGIIISSFGYKYYSTKKIQSTLHIEEWMNLENILKESLKNIKGQQ